MLDLFVIPTANNVISSSSDYAGNFTTEFLPLVYIVLGIIASVVLIRFLINTIGYGLRKVTGQADPDWLETRAQFNQRNNIH